MEFILAFIAFAILLAIPVYGLFQLEKKHTRDQGGIRATYDPRVSDKETGARGSSASGTTVATEADTDRGAAKTT